MPGFFEENNDSILLRVRLSPSSKTVSIKGFFVDANEVEYLKISILSPPEKGKANIELISYLAKKIKIPKSSIKIISGELSQYKKLLLNGNKADIVSQLLILSKEVK